MKEVVKKTYEKRLAELNKNLESVKEIKSQTINWGILTSQIAKEMVENSIQIPLSELYEYEDIKQLLLKTQLKERDFDFMELKELSDMYGDEHIKLLSILGKYALIVDKKVKALALKIQSECKVYELTDKRLYCSNVNLGKLYKTLAADDIVICSEYLMFTQDHAGAWTLQSLSCMDEGYKVNIESLLRGEEVKPVYLILRGLKLVDIEIFNVQI